MQPNPLDYAFVTSFSPVPMAAAVAQLRASVRSTLFSTVFSLGLTAFIWWRSRPVEGTFKWVLIAFIVLAVLRPIILWVRIWRAQRILAKVGQGPALRVDPLGLVLATDQGYERVHWTQVEEVGAKPHHKLPGHDLIVRKVGVKEPWRIPFAFLDVMPGSIDSALRAHTLGAVTLNLKKLDRVF